METATCHVIARLGRNGKPLDYYAGESEHGPRFTLAEGNAYRFTTPDEAGHTLDQLREKDHRHGFKLRPVL